MPIDQKKLDGLLTRARREIDSGLLPSCQVAVAQDGELVTFEAFGDATTETRYPMFSCTKAIVASAVWLLIADGSLKTEQRVVELIPEFGTNGKDAVTVEQVMLHTGGFPHAPLGHPAWTTREGRLAAFAKWRLNWEPGTRYEYHATSAHWVLAELIFRITGQDHRQFIGERVTGPLGLPRLQVGTPLDDQDTIATLAVTGEQATPDELEQAFGVRELPVTEVTDEALLAWNQPEVRAVGVPGGGGIARAADLVLFYQALLHNGAALWPEDLLSDVTGRVRNPLPDPMLGVPANRSLGLVLAGDDGKAGERGFGRTVSASTFGHNGAGGQLAWADPATGVSFCYFTNGLDANVLRQGRRGVALGSLAGSLTEP
jgi:CubicO group peptidase (beta-lactamase class C family)